MEKKTKTHSIELNKSLSRKIQRRNAKLARIFSTISPTLKQVGLTPQDVLLYDEKSNRLYINKF